MSCRFDNERDLRLWTDFVKGTFVKICELRDVSQTTQLAMQSDCSGSRDKKLIDNRHSKALFVHFRTLPCVRMHYGGISRLIEIVSIRSFKKHLMEFLRKECVRGEWKSLKASTSITVTYYSKPHTAEPGFASYAVKRNIDFS